MRAAIATAHLPPLESERKPPHTNRPKQRRPRSGDNPFYQDRVFAFAAYGPVSDIHWLGEDSAVVPEQFGHGGPPWTSEQLLLARVLMEAIEEYRKYRTIETRRGQRIYQEVRAWFLSSEDKWPCSFLCICAALNLEADYVRAGVMKENNT